MNPPTFRSDVNGVLPQLTQTVKDICTYLPSLRLTSNSLQIEEHKTGTIINVKPSAPQISNADTIEAEAEPEDFFSSYNQCDIYNSYGKSGEKRTSHYEGANSGVFLEINKYTVNLNGIYANLDRKTFRVTDVANDFFTLYPTLSATDDSAIYGSLRLNFYLTSGAVSPSAVTVFDYPPIYYTWNLSAEWDLEKCAHFSRPGQADYSYEFASKGNYEDLTGTGMPTAVNNIVGLFKLSNLKEFSDSWHEASGFLSGMSNPKLDAYCKTTDTNPTIFMSFTDELLNYIHTANAEAPHEG